jgi:hypothetical protein
MGMARMWRRPGESSARASLLTIVVVSYGGAVALFWLVLRLF